MTEAYPTILDEEEEVGLISWLASNPKARERSPRVVKK